MALVDDTVYEYFATFVDRDRNQSVMRFNLPASLAVADARAAGQSIVAAAAALSNAAILRDGLSIGRVDNVLNYALIPEAAEVQRKAVFSFRAVNGQNVKIEIPSVDSTHVVDGTNFLNSIDTAVVAFQTQFLNTGLGPANSPVTNVGADIDSWVPPARKIHRGSNKG